MFIQRGRIVGPLGPVYLGFPPQTHPRPVFSRTRDSKRHFVHPLACLFICCSVMIVLNRKTVYLSCCGCNSVRGSIYRGGGYALAHPSATILFPRVTCFHSPFPHLIFLRPVNTHIPILPSIYFCGSCQ